MKRVSLLLLIAVVGIIIAYQIMDRSDEPRTPKVLNPTDVEPEMVDSLLRNKGFGHRIGSFKFTDQEGKPFSSDQLDNKIYVAEYFFTTCSTICPRMNIQMKRVQERFASESTVEIVSFTVDPETDDVEQMKKYAERMDAIEGKWHFLTGSKDSLYHLARNSFFVLKPAEAENAGDAGNDFIHTNHFVLVDQHKRIRGYYDGTSAREVDQLMRDIDILLNEKN